MRNSFLSAANRARVALSALTVLAVLSASAQAQSTLASAPGDGSLEVRVISGGFLATGKLRNDISDAGLFGGQVGWQFHRNWAAVGTFGWAPASTRTLTTNQHVDALQYDVGVEGRLPSVTQVGDADVALFAGAGGGGRTYSVRRGGGSDTRLDGYGSLGFELSRGSSPFTFRTEARDYLTSYRGVEGTLPNARTRNDVSIFAGLGYRF